MVVSFFPTQTPIRGYFNPHFRCTLEIQDGLCARLAISFWLVPHLFLAACDGWQAGSHAPLSQVGNLS